MIVTPRFSRLLSPWPLRSLWRRPLAYTAPKLRKRMQSKLPGRSISRPTWGYQAYTAISPPARLTSRPIPASSISCRSCAMSQWPSVGILKRITSGWGSTSLAITLDWISGLSKIKVTVKAYQPGWALWSTARATACSVFISLGTHRPLGREIKFQHSRHLCWRAHHLAG